MKINLRRIIKATEVITEEKYDKIVTQEVSTIDVQCVYKDQNGVFLSLKSGRVFKVDHTLREMTECFVDNRSYYPLS